MAEPFSVRPIGGLALFDPLIESPKAGSGCGVGVGLLISGGPRITRPVGGGAIGVICKQRFDWRIGNLGEGLICSVLMELGWRGVSEICASFT